MSVRVTCRDLVRTDDLQEVDPDAALVRWRGGEGCFWILLDTDAPAEVAGWLRTRQLLSGGLEKFLEPGHGASLQVLEDALVFQLSTMASEALGDPSTTTFVCLERLLIQIRQGPSSPDTMNHQTTLRPADLPEVSISGLVCALLILHSATLLAAAVRLRAHARGLAARMDQDANSVGLDDIVTLKRRIRDLDEANDDQMALFTALKVVRRSGVDLRSITDFFQVAITNAESCDRAVDRLTTQAGDLKSSFDAFQQGKLTRRLGLLTIVSTIFLPLTLLAGIYGMNFDLMPELHLPFGYPALLVVMAISAGGMLWYFWSRGWFTDL